MSYLVLVTAAAERDLAGIHRWIAREAGWTTADGFLDRLAERIAGLKDYPMRGVVPHELTGLGADTIRQTIVPPYRLFYIVEDAVTIFAVAHGRRDLRGMLEQRLLET